MISEVRLYERGVCVPREIPLETAFEVGRDSPGFVWIELVDPTPAELDVLRDEFALHPLAIEDALRPHQRPKLAFYDGAIFAVLKSAEYVDEREEIDIGEYHVFCGDSFVLTVRHGTARPLDQLRAELERAPEVLVKGPGAVLHGVLDLVVDDYDRVVDEIENDLDQIEEVVFSGVRTNPAQRIYRLKRELLTFNRGVQPLSDALMPLASGRLADSLVAPELHDVFRDVLDHVLRIRGRIESARETLTSALDATLTQISVQQNEDMRATAGWAAVIAVPTLIAGIWGMNFQHMPELEWFVGYPIGLTTIVVSGLFTRWRLRRNGWI